MHHFSKTLLAATLLTVAASSYASTSFINFDNLSASSSINSITTPVSNQYASQGVIFSDLAGPVGTVLGTAVSVTGYSSPNVLFAWQHQTTGDAADLKMAFTGTTQSVSFDSFLSADYYLNAYAYDSKGVLIGTYTSGSGQPYGALMHNVINTSSPINYLLVTSHPSSDSGYYGNFSIDNLSFQTSPVPEPESYALMLGGLGLMGFIARRNKSAS